MKGTVRMRHATRGMTLIELLAVIIILGILTTIAVPSYRAYLIRSQRTEARTSLLQVQAAQEKFYLQNNAYTNNMTALGVPATSDTGLYTIAVPTLGAAGQSYTATATPVTGGSQAADTKCTQLSVTDTGVRGATGSGGVAQCWR